MIRSTLGAPLGGTTRGGHQGVESFALSLMTPPNGVGGAGSWLPSMVVVALGEPGTPVTTCAGAGPAHNRTMTIADVKRNTLSAFTIFSPPQSGKENAEPVHECR